MSDDIKALRERMRQFANDNNVQFVTAQAPRDDTYTEEEMNQYFSEGSVSNILKPALQKLVDKRRFATLLDAFTAARNTPDFFKRQSLEDLYPYTPGIDPTVMIVDSCADVVDTLDLDVEFINGAEYLTVQRGKHRRGKSESFQFHVDFNQDLREVKELPPSEPDKPKE